MIRLAIFATLAAWQVYFSPSGGVEAAVVKALSGAKRVVRVQAYSFTNAPIARALADARRRGVVVEAVLDKSNATARYSAATYLANAGVPTFIDASHAIAHNKVILIDDDIVITGSFNFSAAAETSNAENLLILTDPALHARYLTNYAEHRAHARPYSRAK